MRLVHVDRVGVGAREIEALVRVADHRFLRTSDYPGLAERALALLPGLARHSCDNDGGLRFRDEMRDTELPHLLEHLTCELMALAGSPRSLRARTTWDFTRDGVGVFRVRVAFDDDLVALGALKAASEVLDWVATGDGPEPDVSAQGKRLRALRAR